MTLPSLRIKTLPHHEGLPLPTYATPGSAGMDLAAALSEDVVLKPGERSLISTGIMIALHPGLEAQIRPRSGLAYKDGLTVLNAPGTIDSDYRGEIKVLLINLGAQSFTLTRGMRIAQLVVAPVTQITWHLAEDLEEGTKSKRMAGGFGSTGLHAL